MSLLDQLLLQETVSDPEGKSSRRIPSTDSSPNSSLSSWAAYQKSLIMDDSASANPSVIIEEKREIERQMAAKGITTSLGLPVMLLCR
jgi:hypothetical protein